MLCRVDRKMFWAFAAVTAWSLSRRGLGTRGLAAAGPGSLWRSASSPARRQPDDVRQHPGPARRAGHGDPSTEGPTGPAAARRSTTAAGYADPAANAAAPAPAAGATGLPPGATVVGSNLSGIVFFKDGEFLNFSTPNKDFTMHLGGWVQWDNVWWNQPAAVEQPLRTPRRRQPSRHRFRRCRGGMNNGGNGTLQDGDYWRRLRIVQEGTFWETGEYRFNWALENIQYGTAGLDEMWVGQNDIPVIGSVRVGHVKNADGPGRRYDQFQPLHDLHGTVVLFRSHRTEPELRYRPLVRQQLRSTTA